uniref:Monodehydroascorbate reductase n=1 Tax=Tanacetum cinerariifolium TaxID=118510 RepID=A0A699ISQ8_TANCI|nr:hypothetical protein [Tanacetum cinerariifolium]
MLTYEAKTGAYSFHPDETRFVLDANLLRDALEITPIDQAHQFVSPSSSDAIMDFVNQLGYTEIIYFVSRIAVNNLYQPWRAILSMINQCLTGKTSGHDRPRYPVLQILWGIITSTNFDYDELLWEEFVQAIQTFLTDKENMGSHTKKGRKDKPHVILYYRFTKLIICHLGIIHNIHHRSTSLFHLAEEDLRLADRGKIAKVHKVKSPFQLVNEPDEEPAQSEPEPEPELVHQGEGNEDDMELAIQMSLESFQAQSQAHIGCVVTRELRRTPVSEEASTEPSAQAQDDTFINIVRDSPSPVDAETETGAASKKTNNGGDTEILQFDEEKGKDVDDKVNLEEKTSELDQGHAGDPFINDKSIEDEPCKLNAESKVVSMVTVPIHQASSSIPPLSTPIIDLSPPKPASSTNAPIFTVTTTTTTANLPLPPPPPQQSTSDSELVACVTKLEQKLAAFEQKSKTLDNTTQNLGSKVFTLELRDLPHKINKAFRESVKEAVHVTNHIFTSFYVNRHSIIYFNLLRVHFKFSLFS